MNTYRVEWVIDIEADSPEEAARKALKIQRNPASIATVFDVLEMDHSGDVTRVDLEELDGRGEVQS